MGCSVLNSLYQLDISLVEICFIYTLKLGIESSLSMLAHNPRLQFVTDLPDSPKIEAKGVVLVKGSWYETPGSPRLPFDLNQSLSFPSLFQLGGACTLLDCLCIRLFFEIFVCFDMPFLSEIFIGRRKQGRLVSWVEKASLEPIRQATRDPRGGAQSRAPLVHEELTGIRRQPLPLHSPYHSPSIVWRTY